MIKEFMNIIGTIFSYLLLLELVSIILKTESGKKVTPLMTMTFGFAGRYVDAEGAVPHVICPDRRGATPCILSLVCDFASCTSVYPSPI